MSLKLAFVRLDICLSKPNVGFGGCKSMLVVICTVVLIEWIRLCASPAPII